MGVVMAGVTGAFAQGPASGPATPPPSDPSPPPPPARASEPVAGAILPSPQGCKGWGLTTPLFGISNRDFNNTTETRRTELLVTGPIQSGLGGGYFKAVQGGPKCEDFAFGWELFGLSEGLNPADKFQIGVGAGLSLHVWGKFSFGLALGVDLIRREKYTRGGMDVFINNGVLIFNDGNYDRRDWLNNLTLLITFNVSDNKSKGEGSGSTAGGGSGS